jgi:hypothetical protein
MIAEERPMNKLSLFATGIALWALPACITVNEADNTCPDCAGAKSDDTTSGGTSAGGSSTGGTTAEAGQTGTATAGASGATDEGAGGEGGAAPLAMPKTISIELVGALIGPGKIDGTQWDLTDQVPPEILDALADAYGYPGMGKVLEVVQSAAYQALSKPDPFGVANLNPDGVGFDSKLNVNLADEATNTEDTFTPLWPMPFPGWQRLQVEPGMEVRVTLYDEDLALNDDIGTATITYDDILEAWTAGDSHWIRVEDQTNEQLIAVQIQVSGK